MPSKDSLATLPKQQLYDVLKSELLIESTFSIIDQLQLQTSDIPKWDKNKNEEDFLQYLAKQLTGFAHFTWKAWIRVTNRVRKARSLC